MPDLVRIRVCEQIKSALENLGAAVAIICEQYSGEARVQETGKKVIELVLELQELADGLEDVGEMGDSLNCASFSFSAAK